MFPGYVGKFLEQHQVGKIWQPKMCLGYIDVNLKGYTGWWFHHPFEKYAQSSNWIISPGIGVKK